MLRHAARRLVSRTAVASTARRALATAEVPAEAAEDSTFVEAWKKVAPNIEPPTTPLSLMQPRPPTPATIPTKLTVNFVLPYKSEIANKEVYIYPSAAPAPAPSPFLVPDLCVRSFLGFVVCTIWGLGWPCSL